MERSEVRRKVGISVASFLRADWVVLLDPSAKLRQQKGIFHTPLILNNCFPNSFSQRSQLSFSLLSLSFISYIFVGRSVGRSEVEFPEKYIV